MAKKTMVPQHIAIIMDGNGRWAKQRGLLRIFGHKQGAKVAKNIIRACDKAGVRFLTLYTFSTENWKRPKPEVNFLMQLLEKSLKKEVQNLMENNVRFMTIGRINGLPKKVQQVMQGIKEKTKKNTGFTLILAFNYGGRLELVDAALSLAKDIKSGRIPPDKVNEEIFSQYLYTKGIPDPELLIRTSGEMRLSNFMPWQLCYSELYVTKKFWPDFTEADLKQAIEDYKNRERRFGAV